jgi:large subunit ribosomal protein L17
MRHRKHTAKLGRNVSHRRCLMANLLKTLIENERIETTVPKAKELRRHADKMITLAKQNDLASRRRATAVMMVRRNPLTPKQARLARGGDLSSYNIDRRVVEKLFGELGPRFSGRQGGYTRIVRTDRRVGDNAPLCIIEWVGE